MPTARQSILAQAVYECVRHYAQMWEATSRAAEFLARVEGAKAACRGEVDDVERLADDCFDRAWQRLCAEGRLRSPPLRGRA